jgi:hypothetical protein
MPAVRRSSRSGISPGSGSRTVVVLFHPPAGAASALSPYRTLRAVLAFLADKAKNRRPRTITDYTRMLNVHFLFKGQLRDAAFATTV